MQERPKSIPQGLKPSLIQLRFRHETRPRGFPRVPRRALTLLAVLDKFLRSLWGRASEAEARVDFVGFVRGLKPPPPSEWVFIRGR